MAFRRRGGRRSFRGRGRFRPRAGRRRGRRIRLRSPRLRIGYRM